MVKTAPALGSEHTSLACADNPAGTARMTVTVSMVRIRMLRTELDDDRVSVRGHIVFESVVRPSVDQEPNVSCGAVRAAVAISVDLARGKRNLISDECDTGGGKETSEIRIASRLRSRLRPHTDHAVPLPGGLASRPRPNGEPVPVG